MSFRFHAVLFDFDGTLADSYDAITASVNHVAAHHKLPPLPEPEVRIMVGHGLLQLMADIIPGGDAAQNAELYRAHHPTVMYQHTRLLPGAGAALEQLHARNIKMAVCSNKPAAITKKLIVALKVSEYLPLDAVFGPEDAQNPKPHPGMVQAALNHLNVSADEALFIGDMSIDIETARNAGLEVWVLPTGSSDVKALQLAKPDRILNSMDELVKELGIS